MVERRIRRSRRKDEALRLLLEAVKARSEVTSIAIVDARGHVVTGMGTDRELAILGAIAEPVAGGMLSGLAERLTEGTDVISKEINAPRGRVYLAALGDRVGRMYEAASGIERILARTA